MLKNELNAYAVYILFYNQVTNSFVAPFSLAHFRRTILIHFVLFEI